MSMHEPAGKARPREVVAVAAGGVVLLILNVVLFLRVTLGNGHNSLRPIPGWAFSALSSIIVIALIVLALRIVSERESRLRDVNGMLMALEGVTQSTLAHGSYRELPAAIAKAVHDVLGGTGTAIAMSTGPDEDDEVLAATVGACQRDPAAALRDPRSLAAGAVARRRPAIFVPGTTADGDPICEGTASVAAPLVVGDRATGVLEVGFHDGADVTNDVVRLLQVVADRVAAAINGARLLEAERRSHLAAEHARSHLSLIAQASRLFATALEDHEPILAQVGALLVPAFADWCVVELADDAGTLRTLVARHADRTLDARMAELFRRHRAWNGPVRQAVSSGHSELRYGLLNTAGTDGDRVDDFTALVRALRIESIIILPIRVRGLSLGAITLGRVSERRGFRPSDQRAGEDMADRAAVAIERVTLYRETVTAAEKTARHADQLRRLVQAGLEITQPLSRPAVLRVLADQARRVLGGERALAVLDEPGTHLEMGSPPGPDTANLAGESAVFDASVLEVGIPVTRQGATASIKVRRSAGMGFSDEDEAILASMAQMTAVALENARLYQAMESNEERLGALVEAAPLAIVDLDLNRRARTWNRAAEDMFGWAGHGNVDVDAASRPVFPSAIEQALAPLCDRAELGQPSLDVEVAGEGPKGRMTLSTSTVPLRDRFGEVSGILAVVADITARKSLEEQLLQSQRMEAIGRLAGGVAHDFNNLLTVILGYSDLLLRRMKDDDRARADLEAVRNAGQQAANLTAQLLTVGRRQVVEPDVIVAKEVLASIEEVLRRLLSEDIEVVIDARDGRVLMDPTHLEQVVLNLVVNAGDAMPEGGRLTVDIREVEVDQYTATTTGTARPGRYVQVAVTDTGTGMPPEVVEQCFEPFFTTKGKTKGTGLGLATVYGIVTQSGGFIEVDTDMGAGTTIRVLLPAVSEETETTPAGDDGATPTWLPSGFEYILLVEDEHAVRALASDVLRTHGYQVVEASNGEEALELAAEHDGAFDLLVTDVIMPGIDGVELARQVGERWPGIAVLYVSGYTGAAKEKLEAVTRSSNFLSKPFAPEALARRVREVLDARAAAGSDAQGSKR